MTVDTLLRKPYFWLAAGGIVVAGALGANALKGNPSLAAGLRPPIEMRPARVDPSTLDSSALATIDSLTTSLADQASQAVVHITTDLGELDTGRQSSRGRGMMGGEGSGFVYRSDGWIVTNDHVVSGLDQVRVVLADGREVVGKVTRSGDPQLDIAVVKVAETGLPSLALADSNAVKPGQFAMAVGAPFSLENSVTIGHVSAVSRAGAANDPVNGPRGYSGMIQTDASINPGNSGGPLIDSRGEVIGVNTSIYTTTGGSNGIGFAIPANVVRAVADELIEKGKFDRGFLGVAPADLKPFEKKKLGAESGAIVREAEQNGIAYKAGLRVNDVITQIDEIPVRNEVDLRVALYRHSPGETINVQFKRGSEQKSVLVKLGAPEPVVAQNTPRNAPESPFGNQFPDFFGGQDENPPTAPTERPRLGVVIQQLDANSRSQFGLPAEVKGVVVMTVTDGSFAQKIGIQPGDVLVQIGSKTVSTVDDVATAMGGVRMGQTLRVRFARFSDGARQDFTTEVPFR
jgi:serine protease Do